MSAPKKALIRIALVLATLGELAGVQAQSPAWTPTLRETLKGDAKLSEAPSFPEFRVPLVAPAEDSGVPPGGPACGAQLASIPMAIGPRDEFAAAKNAGMGFLSKLASVASGGKFGPSAPAHGAEKKEPPVLKDPIKSKFRHEVKDKPSGIRLDLGAELEGPALLISSRLDSVSGKGTVHEVYLERDDCRRIYPTAEYLYELWGSWSLSVSWTRTESTYQDGRLVNQQTTGGGFTRSGTFGPGGTAALDAAFASLPAGLAGPAKRYQAELRGEMTSPMWRRLGFASPTSGARAVGTRFLLSAGDLKALQSGRLTAIVQVTRERGPLFEAVGVPVALAPGKDQYLGLSALNRGP